MPAFPSREWPLARSLECVVEAIGLLEEAQNLCQDETQRRGGSAVLDLVQGRIQAARIAASDSLRGLDPEASEELARLERAMAEAGMHY